MVEYYRFKAVYDLFMKGLDEEAKLQLSKLQRHYVALCDENISLKTQVQEYEDILYIAKNLFFDGRLYWLNTGNVRQGPFCPQCYGERGLLMRLAGDWHDQHCPSCRFVFFASKTAYNGDLPCDDSETLRRDLPVQKTSFPANFSSSIVIPFKRSE